jgi:hypothetical protein
VNLWLQEEADMAKKKPPHPTDDFREALETAAKPPHEQLELIFRFLRDDLATEAAQTTWSGVLKSLPLRPCASASGRLKIQWLVPLTPEALSLEAVRWLQTQIRQGIRDVLDLPSQSALRGIWNLPAPHGVSMTARPGEGFVWQYRHFRGGADADDLVRGSIVLAVAQLVAEHAARIRACKLPGCGALFLATKRQEYCTPEHGQLARDRRKGERNRKGTRR